MDDVENTIDNQDMDLRLIEAVRQGDEATKEELVFKYIPMVKHIVRNYYASFMDFDDLMQEGVIGLLSAISEYKPEYNVKFSSFAYICIIRKIYNVIKHANGNKHRALNEAISLYNFVSSEETRILLDLVINDDEMLDPVFLIETKTINHHLNQVLRNHLSLLEYSVISLLLRGYSCAEIEAEIGVGAKAVDNARTRVKAKLRKIIDEHGSLLSPRVPSLVRKRKDLYLRLGG